ncbi:hypothetical protein ISCGN_030947 [Ixodes scapularis]|uniref:Uncharacterized protein n=1 Tax=Ixodes scapularis TaxID=6945 RepID=B7PEH8_IXOSC|nr:hypothetical protein IscW_ISCW018105 [Ixodes scapularis]|eukprot:XP_002433600.1 hypothetical protein IscW_ISCW018105 [Ixodes scapularis]
MSLEEQQGRAPLVRSHYSMDSGHESSYGSVRTVDSEAAREAWARHPYYSSQEEARRAAQPTSSAHRVEAKGSRSSKTHKKHRKSSKQGSTGSKGAARAAAVGDGASAIPDKTTLKHQIDQNRDAMMMKQKQLQKKQQEYARYRALSAAGPPSYAAMIVVCIWITLVAGFSILAFGWLFSVFVQATPFFYVSLGTGSSLVLLGAFLTIFRSKPASSAFGF